jgi:ubiquinone/menaquinone biosynthesis C-methylase UbiE
MSSVPNKVSGDRLAEHPNTSTASLSVRLDANRQYSAIDFQDWLQSRLDVREGMHVLDVGCGTGAQSLEFLRRVGTSGSVSSLDIAPASIDHLRRQAHAGNIQAEVSDMMNLGALIDQTFLRKRFDLAQTTYALYYAKDPLHVLDVMRGVVEPGGRIAACVPNNPHGFVEFVRRFCPVPEAATASGQFGPDVLEPYFRTNFDEVTVHLLRNMQRLPDVESVMQFWRNTSYFDPSAASNVRAAVERQIASDGHFAYAKHSFLIIGQKSLETR